MVALVIPNSLHKHNTQTDSQIGTDDIAKRLEVFIQLNNKVD